VLLLKHSPRYVFLNGFEECDQIASSRLTRPCQNPAILADDVRPCLNHCCHFAIPLIVTTINSETIKDNLASRVCFGSPSSRAIQRWDCLLGYLNLLKGKPRVKMTPAKPGNTACLDVANKCESSHLNIRRHCEPPPGLATLRLRTLYTARPQRVTNAQRDVNNAGMCCNNDGP